MNHEITQIEVIDLEADSNADVGVELSDLEVQAVSGGLRPSWTCGRPKAVDEWH